MHSGPRAHPWHHVQTKRLERVLHTGAQTLRARVHWGNIERGPENALGALCRQGAAYEDPRRAVHRGAHPEQTGCPKHVLRTGAPKLMRSSPAEPRLMHVISTRSNKLLTGAIIPALVHRIPSELRS